MNNIVLRRASRVTMATAGASLAFGLWLAGCTSNVAAAPPATSSSGTQGTPLASASPTPALKSDPAPVAPVAADLKHSDFDADKAFALLKKQCDFGPRVLGTKAHDACRDFLLTEMKKYADKTLTQEFTYRGMTVTNIVGVFYPAGAKAPGNNPVLLLTHWDARPIADGPYSTELRKGDFRYGPKGWNRQTPIAAASDGASGTAALLELARILKTKRPPCGVIMLLDDGEDYGDFRANGFAGEGVELGSRYFAKHYTEEKSYGQPRFGILLDMVGGKNVNFPRESNAQQFAPDINEKVYSMGGALGYDKIFRSDLTQSVEDDHMAINRAGIQTIDLIHPLPTGNPDTDGGAYRWWHTLEDTPDKCSPDSLKAVGDTLAAVLYHETP